VADSPNGAKKIRWAGPSGCGRGPADGALQSRQFGPGMQRLFAVGEGSQGVHKVQGSRKPFAMERPTLDVRVASQHFPQLSCVRGVAVGKGSMRFVCTGSAVFIVSADGTLESFNVTL